MEPVDRIGRFEQQQLLSPPLSYAEWAFPGILGMNVMFSALFGVGWVIVHYRKTRVLRRLRVTPLRASEFLAAQILARLVIVAANTGIVFTLGAWILDISVKGSWGHLGLAYFLSLVSIGVVVSARTSSEELASGVINLMTWPMMLLSEIWFSLEGLPKWVERVASIMPLTHLNRAVRAIVNDGAGWAEVQAHFVYMGLLAALFLAIGSAIFRWESDT
jgi:ABC-type multidrug transport system permease subunit